MNVNLWSTGVVALLLATACSDTAPAPPQDCRPASVRHEPPQPPDITAVNIYWDVSGSMKGYIGRKGDPGSALVTLWASLDRSWARRVGTTVEAARHRLVGTEIVEAKKVGVSMPPLNAARTNLTAAGLEAGSLLADSPGTAVVFVSDMLVDAPTGKAGEPLCGNIPVPAGRGDIPSLFGKCFAEGLGQTTPDFLSIGAVAIRAPLGGRTDIRPLFVLVASRNPEYTDGVLEQVRSALADMFDPAVLLFAQHQPVVECAKVDRCVFHRRSDVILREGDGSKDCSFFVPSATRAHQVRCGYAEAAVTNAALLAPLTVDVVSSLEAAKLKADEHSFDMMVPLSGEGSRSADIELRATQRWALLENHQEKFEAWLGERWASDTDYEDFFLITARLLEKSMPAPTCAQSWRFRYQG